jgi:hypothetical protein
VTSFVAFVALWTNCLAAEPSSIGYPSVAAALSALTRDPAAHFETQGGWTIVTTVENGNHVVWSFVPRGHPAYPAAVKRTVVEENGVAMKMSVLCSGHDKAACDKLVEEFKLKIKQSLHRGA